MSTSPHSKTSARKDKDENRAGTLEKYKKKLPNWLTDPITDLRAWKTLLRCMLAVFATLVLVVCQPTLNVLGSAAFFGLIVSMMIPPSLALSMFLIAALMIVLGMCLGWAWGCAAMAAGLRARSQVLLASEVQTAQAGYNTDANIDAQYQGSIFRGDFLDPRSSAVIGVFFFFGTYALGWLRAAKPRLTIAAIFGTIVMDVMCSYAPLFPIAQYTLARSFLIPSACYFAIAISLTILIFPQSNSSIFLTSFTRTNLAPILQLLRLQDDVLTTSPGDHDQCKELAEKARKLRAGHVAGVMALQPQVGLLQLEVSRGRLGPGDLGKIFEKAKDLGARAYGLASFVMLLDEKNQALTKINDSTGGHSAVRVRTGLQKGKEIQHPNTTLESLLPILATSTSELRLTASKSLQDASSWLNELNHSRWRVRNPTASTLREQNLKQLQIALSEFRTSKHFTLLEPFHDAFDQSGRMKASYLPSIRSSTGDMFRCHVFTSNLISFSLSLIDFLEELGRCERGCVKNKWQWPTKFVEMARKSVNDKEGGGNPLDVGTVDEHAERGRGESSETLVGDHEDTDDKVKKEKKNKTKKEEKKNQQKTYAKDPDAGDPTNAFQRFGRGASGFGKHLVSTNGVFALKYAIVSIALWVPQVCHNSAYFVYTNRGLWALIMAQTGLGIFAGEQITTFLVRFGATCLGLILGMVMWYIGAGTGRGSPYGIVAVSVFGIAPILWCRIHAPPTSLPFWLMTGVTAFLIVGYGWVDEHIYQTANQGSGASLAGRRALLVLIGFAAAFVMMLLPRPTTARRVVRLNIARNLSETGDLYAKIMTGLEEEVEMVEGAEGVGNGKEVGVVGKKVVKARIEKYRGSFIKILARMQTVQQQSAFAGFEPGIKGPWPKKTYKALMRAHLNLVGSLALLSAAYARLTPKWTSRLERSHLMQPAFIADCMALFTILHQSLSTGQAMPPTMLIFERLAYHEQRNRAREVKHEPSAGNDSAKHVESDQAGELEVREDLAALKALGEPLSWDLIHDEQLSVFATAIVALSHVVNGLNEIQQIVISLVGESSLGTKFDIAQDRWSRRETEV